MMPLRPERKAELDDYAERHGQNPVTALDNALEVHIWKGSAKISRKPLTKSVRDTTT